MTNEEAIYNIYMMWETLGAEKSDVTDAFSLAVKALQKQIPIKPHATKLPKGGYSYTCPRCEHKTDHYYAKTGVNKWMNYCHICGHRLDWKDVE